MNHKKIFIIVAVIAVLSLFLLAGNTIANNVVAQVSSGEPDKALYTCDGVVQGDFNLLQQNTVKFDGPITCTKELKYFCPLSVKTFSLLQEPSTGYLQLRIGGVFRDSVAYKLSSGAFTNDESTSFQLSACGGNEHNQVAVGIYDKYGEELDYTVVNV